MSNVISFNQAQKHKAPPKDARHVLTVELWEHPDGRQVHYCWSPDLIPDGDNDPAFAAAISRWLAMAAWHNDKSMQPDEAALAMVRVFANCRVSVMYDDDRIVRPEQAEWLKQRLLDAAELCTPSQPASPRPPTQGEQSPSVAGPHLTAGGDHPSTT